MFKHILLPTDGSALAMKAVQAGIALAKEMGASVTGYYAIEPAPHHLTEGYVRGERLADELERRSQDIARRSMDEVNAAARAAGVPCDIVISETLSAYQGIIQTASRMKCDAVFMASHGERGLASLLIGSVTHKVLAHSKIPVLVFR
jgi:nucleotide-binding universal stress UspA family protein